MKEPVAIPAVGKGVSVRVAFVSKTMINAKGAAKRAQTVVMPARMLILLIVAAKGELLVHQVLSVA